MARHRPNRRPDRRPDPRPDRRPGRRPGNQGTRAAILDAARQLFATLGYDGTSIRRIATTAGVDPALVHHYFGTKEQLFSATVEPPVDPATLLPEVFADGLAGFPERLLRALLAAWEDPVTGPALLATVRAAVSSTVSAGLIREFFVTRVLSRLARELTGRMDPAEARLRVSLVASQVLGLALARYVLRLDPLAGASHDTVVAVVAPTLRRYIDDEDLLRQSRR